MNSIKWLLTSFSLKVVISLTLIFLGIYLNDEYSCGLRNTGIVLLVTTTILDGGLFLKNNWSRLRFVVHSMILSITGNYIRFSMSYQYIIKVNDKFLLVKNSNPNWDWYQHVGGKYKRISETDKILKDLEAKDDLKQKTSGLKKGDLAVFIPSKNAVKFIDWFNKEKEREISHWREFYEELIGEKGKDILNSKDFPYVNYKYLKTVRTPIKRAPSESGWNCWEVLQYDILELIPTENQLKKLIELQEKGDTEYYKWASASLINNLGHVDNDHGTIYKIGQHTKWVINGNYSKG